MRTSLLALLMVFGTTVSASAQLRIEITDGQFVAGMPAATTPYAAGGPWAAIPAKALKPGIDPTATDFRIRAWVEGNGVRALVFAVTRRTATAMRELRDNDPELQIASVLVTAGRSVEIDATAKYRSRPVTLTVRTGRTYVVIQHGIDIPERRFNPLPRR